ncbi:hypothetical protein [Nitrosopumilus sp. S4]
MTVEQVKEKLLKKYAKTHGGSGNRDLIIMKQKEGYGDSTYLVLDGSPPKGYGIWIDDRRTLNLYDANGDNFRKYYLQMGISGLEESN